MAQDGSFGGVNRALPPKITQRAPRHGRIKGTPGCALRERKRKPPIREGWAVCRETSTIGSGFARPQVLSTPLRRPGTPGAQRVDLLIGGKPPGLLFRIHQPAIDGNLEYPGYPGHQLDLGAVTLFQHCPRTEGPRFIVSRLAPLDSYLHLLPLHRGPPAA